MIALPTDIVNPLKNLNKEKEFKWELYLSNG